jgi:hypothetical protein
LIKTKIDERKNEKCDTEECVSNEGWNPSDEHLIREQLSTDITDWLCCAVSVLWLVAMAIGKADQFLPILCTVSYWLSKCCKIGLGA